MQFTSMSAWLFAGFAVLLAGALAALQYLRTRPRRTRVVTALFWQQAAEETRARSLFGRFRHPRTYLLLLAASLLVLLALAAPVILSENAPHRVIALEAGLEMGAADGRFENALALLRAETRSVGEERVAVITADPQPRVLKHFDESLPTLEGRLAALKPADAPVPRDVLLESAKALLAGRENGELVLITAQPAALDDDRIRVLAAGENTGNAFPLSAVFIPDPADPTRGEFRCRIGFTGTQSSQVTVAITRDASRLFTQTLALEPGGTQELVLSDLAADGSLLNIALESGDTIPGDNLLDFPLPDRRPIRLVAAPGFGMPAALEAVVRSLPEVSSNSSEGAGAIRIGPVGSEAEIRIHPAGDGGEELPVRASGHALVAGLEFEDALCRAPGVAIPRTPGDLPLLMAGDAPLAILDPASGRLTVADSLLDGQASVVRRGGYLVFWATLFRHLAGWQDTPPSLPPAEAARWTDADSAPVVMKAGFGNLLPAPAGTAAAPGESAAARPPLWRWLLIAALALMLAEAVLHLRGKIT